MTYPDTASFDPSPQLVLRELTRSFGALTAVNNIHLTINAGEMVGVIGRSGAGKSTLLRLINRLVEPSAGQVLSQGRVITDLKGHALRSWRAECAMIFQQFNLVPRLNVLTNVLMGRLSYHSTFSTLVQAFSDEERAEAVDTLVKLDLRTQILQRVETLSGGQQQRVAIAKALMQHPKLLLADEPTASLDPMNARLILELLRDINRTRNITVIGNLHHIELAQEFCTRIIAFKRGEIVFDGPVSTLSQRDISALYQNETQTREAISSMQ